MEKKNLWQAFIFTLLYSIFHLRLQVALFGIRVQQAMYHHLNKNIALIWLCVSGRHIA